MDLDIFPFLLPAREEKKNLQKTKSDRGDSMPPHVGPLVAGDMYICW